MWHDDDAHPLKQQHEDFIANEMKRIGTSSYNIPRPLTVMDSYPEAQKHTASLEKEVGRIHDKYNKLWKDAQKNTRESMSPFKQQDGERLQKPRVNNFPVEKNATNRNRNNPRGYGASKRDSV